MTKHVKVALCRDSTLSIISLTSSSDPVWVPTSPGYKMLLPAIVILVRLGSNFGGRNSQPNLLREIYFLLLTGIFSCLTTKKVSEPANCCFLGPYFTLPTPWHRRPS